MTLFDAIPSGAGDIPALDAIRVLDLSLGMAGSLAAMQLADDGAEVIKVEPPGGDPGRGSAGFEMWNRGKRSVVLDLETESDRRRLHALSRTVDVVIDDRVRPAQVATGTDGGALLTANGRLVHCSISGFGSAAGFEDLGVDDDIVSAAVGRLVGLDEIRGAASGNGDGRPVYLLTRALSFSAGQLAVQGILAGLLRRAESGAGCRVHTSLAQAATTLSMRRDFARPIDPAAASKGRSRGDLRYRGIILTFMTAECADGRWIQMCARTDHHFRNWLVAVGLGEVLADPRYARAPLGISSIEALEDLEGQLRERMRTRKRDEWLALFGGEADVPCDPFLLPEEFLAHPQMQENERVVVITDSEGRSTVQPGPLLLQSECPSAIGSPAPRLGEGNNEILGALGDDREPGRAVVASAPSRLGPLDGITVLELAYFIAGPLGAAGLAELGARVIKVEPAAGDPWRPVGLESVHMLHGKESVVLDLKSELGTRALHELIRRSDVLITSFRPDSHARLGMDFATASTLNPGLVYIYAGSYGSRGPWANKAAFHSTPNALCGSGILQAGRGNPPVDDDFPDPISGITVATAALTGLWARRRSGRGQLIETTMLSTTAHAFSDHLVFGPDFPAPAIPDAAQLGVSALRRLYRCADGWLMLAADAQGVASRLRELVGIAEGADWAAALEAAFLTRPAQTWVADLRAAEVPAVQADHESLETFLEKHYELRPMTDPAFGDYWGLPARIDIEGAAPRRDPACAVGEHTDKVLTELGLGHCL